MKPHFVRTILIVVVVAVAAAVLFLTMRSRSGRDGASQQPQGVAATAEQEQAVKALLAAADAVAASLAGDDLAGFNSKAKDIAARTAAAQKAFGADHPWHAELQKLGEHSNLPEAKTLEEARKAFLPFSTAMADFARAARDDTEFASMVVYKCPMVDEAWAGAPKNGFWVQAQGPLRNPWFGKRMLTCGVEVK